MGLANVDHLRDGLSKMNLCGTTNSGIPGVTSTYIYIGLSSPIMILAFLTSQCSTSGEAGAVFTMHREDFMMSSISLNHAGAPKVWFIVPPSQMEKLWLLTKTFDTQNICLNFTINP